MLGNCSKSNLAGDPLSADKYVKSISRKFARAYGMDQEDMEQDCWMGVLHAAQRGCSGGIFSLEARQSAIHAVRYNKTQKRSLEREAYRVNDDGSDYEVECDKSHGDPVFMMYLTRILSEYTVEQRVSFIGYYFYEFDTTEISRITGISLDKVKRAKRAIFNRIRRDIVGG